ncbi:type 1 fimbrial protein [Cronobacter dublinensis]
MRKISWICAALLGVVQSVSAATDNVHFAGTLVAEPCTLPDIDSDITLNFGSVIDKYLYQYQRTKKQRFVIHLQDCDASTFKTVNVTFSGTPDNELTNLLAVDTQSTAKGIAIGLEMDDGTPLPINKASSDTQLKNGNNELYFNSYVQIQPSALSAKSLIDGEFIATSTFVLGYQ